MAVGLARNPELIVGEHIRIAIRAKNRHSIGDLIVDASTHLQNCQKNNNVKAATTPCVNEIHKMFWGERQRLSHHEECDTACVDRDVLHHIYRLSYNRAALHIEYCLISNLMLGCLQCYSQRRNS